MRADQARAKGLPQPSDPSRFTSVKDPTEPFRFSFPDLDGKIVSNTDPQFRGKVVIVSIGGSWCPNCHDEAPFLVELYKKYRSQGLEIVELSFEEEAQLKNPVRAARVHQALRHRLHRADSRRAEGAERQGAAGRQPQLVPDDVLPRPRRPGAQRARRLPRQGERQVPHRGEGRDHGAGRAPAGGEAAPDRPRRSDRSRQTRDRRGPPDDFGPAPVASGSTRSHLGFAVHRRDDRTAWLGAGGADLLVLSQCETAPRVRGTTGLYHFAILVPSRADLARALRRLVDTDTVMQGAADHGVSEALYLADPDGNGIEIYRDRPRDEWPYVDGAAADGRRSARSRRAARGARPATIGAGLAAGTVIGHVHLHVSRLAEAERFYVGRPRLRADAALRSERAVRRRPAAITITSG